MTFAVWLGLPALALIGANLALWRTHRQLRNFGPDGATTQIRLPQVTAAQQSNPAIAS